MVQHPRDYPWSSFHANGDGKDIKLITPHPIYTSLGITKRECEKVYRSLFKAHISYGELNLIRTVCDTGTPLGNDYFKEKIEKKLECKVGQARRGRPSKGL